MDLNIVAITGRLAADPELHSTGNGIEVTTLRIAVGRMKRQGERSHLQIVADQVQFLDYKDRAGDDTSQVPDEPEPSTTPEAEVAEVASPAPVEPAPEDTTAQEPVETPEQPTADGPRRTSRRKKAASK
jgi:single-stranded DNA-binding protein